QTSSRGGIIAGAGTIIGAIVTACGVEATGGTQRSTGSKSGALAEKWTPSSWRWTSFLNAFLPHARAYAPFGVQLAVALAASSHFGSRRSQQQQTPPLDIVTVTPADGSGRIVKNVQPRGTQTEFNTFLRLGLAGGAERPAHAGQGPPRQCELALPQGQAH